MSTTPRTDAHTEGQIGEIWCVNRDFARELERELAAKEQELVRVAEEATRANTLYAEECRNKQAVYDELHKVQDILTAKEQELAEARKEIALLKEHHQRDEALIVFRTDELRALTAQNQDARQQLTARDATIEGLREVLEAVHTIAPRITKHLVEYKYEMNLVARALAQLAPLPSAVPVAPVCCGKPANPSTDHGAVPVHPDTARLEERELQIGERLRKGDIGRWPDGTEIEVPAHFIGEKVRKAGIFFRPTDDAARQSTGEQGTEGAGELDGH